MLAITFKLRLSNFKEVSTLAKLGYMDIEMYAWQGVMVRPKRGH